MSAKVYFCPKCRGPVIYVTIPHRKAFHVPCGTELVLAAIGYPHLQPLKEGAPSQ